MKDVIVETGASSGMGRRFVVQIAKKQKADEIWVIARRKDRLEELAAEITNVKIVPVEADLTNPESAEIYRNKLADEKPNVIILANCAGFGKFGHSETVPVGVQLNMIDLNCKAPVFMIDASLPYESGRENYEYLFVRGVSAHSLHQRLRRNQSLFVKLRQGA